jgi:alpha,alpha-trehalose phosphorylase
VIHQPAYPAESWCLRETELPLQLLAQSESLFALSNGNIGWRGNLDEGEPNGLPGSYLNGCHELRPLPYAEDGYGFPEIGQTLINVTNGKVLRLLVDDEPFDVRYGTLVSHERMLDFHTGVLQRTAEWTSPAGRTVRVRSQRLVSLAQRSIAAISYEVEPVDGPARLVVQSELIANEELPPSGDDPREAAPVERPLHGEFHGGRDGAALLLHRTRRSGLRVAAAMQHQIAGPPGLHMVTETWPDLARVTVTARMEPGQRLQLVKFVAMGWSASRSTPALRDQAEAALAAAMQTGWPGLLAEQEAILTAFWDEADVELVGDLEVQQAVRFGMFHVLQAAARAEDRAIAAKGLTGTGYEGHAFWDTETFVLPVLTYTRPDAAASALRWRHSTLPQALERASQLGLRGAAFPWRTISGPECSGYWPAGTAAFHVNADIADAVIRYVDLTGDQDFEASIGFDLLVQTARLWHSLGHFNADQKFRIDGVTGPDEYSAIADNNVYTNLMAQQNLLAAAELAARYPDGARRLRVAADEPAAWRAAAAAMTIPYDDDLGVHQQSENFTHHQVWNFAGTHASQYPLLQHFPYFDLYRKQVVKQADLVLAMHVRSEAFTAEQKASNFTYYERLTVRDSSLSAATQCVIAAEVGSLELAYDYMAEAALIDLDDIERNVRDGLHLAALAGSWSAAVAGFGGLRRTGAMLSFAPRLPSSLTSLTFTVSARGQAVRVAIAGSTATYTLLNGPDLEVGHHGARVLLAAGQPTTLDVPPPPPDPHPSQPPGREPARRSVQLRRHPEISAAQPAPPG